MSLLEVHEINSSYDNIQVLNKISLEINNSETVCIFGPNGHGKSTLLKVIYGLHRSSSGYIKYNGREITNLPSYEVIKMGIVYIPEERYLFPEMTVMENLNLGAYNLNARKDINKNREFVFHLFPRLKERKNQLCSTLSGGERRMVAIGRGLISSPAFLMLDEPSLGLAPVLKKAVFEKVQQIIEEVKITVLIVEQEIEYALKLADRAYMLKKGEIVFEREKENLNIEDIKKAYF